MKKRLLRVAMIAAGAAVLMGAADGSWLRRVPANDHARVNPLKDQADAAEAGSHLYVESCAKCHGAQGQGKGSRPAMVSARIAGASDGDLAWLLKNGNTWKGMPSWSVMPDSERWQLVAYLRSLNTVKTETSAKCGGLSTAQQTVKLSAASVEMTLPEIEMTRPEVEMTVPEVEMTFHEVEMALPEVDGQKQGETK